MKPLICQHCQTQNDAGAELCVACGQPLDAADPERREDAGTGPVEREEVERWVRQLPEFGKLDEESLATDDESLPAWLQAVRAHADKLTSEEADDLMEFLADLEPGDSEPSGEPPPDEAAVQAKMTSELPAWVAALLPQENWPETEADLTMAQLLDEAEAADETHLPSTAPLPSTRPLGDSPELDGIPEMLAGEALPAWLADQQADKREPDSEEPLAWPSQAKHSRQAGPRHTAQEQAARDKAEADEEPQRDALDAVLDEVEAATVDSPEEPDGPPDEPSGFSDWLDAAQSAALEETLEEMLDLPDADTSEGRVDQWLDILEGLPARRDETRLNQVEDDSELAAAGMPDWMQSMPPEQAPEDRELAGLGPPEESGPLAGLRGVIPAATITLSGGVYRRSDNVVLTKEQREQAAILRRLTSGDPDTVAVTGRPGDDTFMLGRLVLGGALLLVILVGLLVPGVADLLPSSGDAATLPSAAAEAHNAIAANSGRTALVAFEYTPSMAGELDAIAGALLADLAANDVAVLAVSQVAAGVPMAERAMAATEALDGVTIGYVPGEASGLRALSACLEGGCDAVAGRPLRPETRAALADVNLIVILAGDRDGLVNWLEQVGSQSNIGIVGGVTQALAPLARPYLESQQLAGLVEGLAVSVSYSQANGLAATPTTEQLASLTLAQWLVIGALLVGAIYFGFVAPASSAVNQVTEK
ncbi:MAG: hypothetical protein ACK2UH_13285 [Candidatus Promineifilaceae bacterium]